MGFKGNRGPLFLIIIAVIVIVVIAASASSTPPKKAVVDPAATTHPIDPSTVSVTIERAIGIDQITITNLNTGTSIKKTLIDLPYTFTCTKGDFIQLQETTQQGYDWNAWQFDDGTFNNHNPMIISADRTIDMIPKCIITSQIDTSNSTMSG